MSNEIRVVQCGLGPIGAMIVRSIREKTTLRLVGAVDSDETKIGQDVGDLAGLAKPLGVTVTDDLGGVLEETQAQVVIVATTSSLRRACPQIVEIVSHQANVVSTCEELAYPWKTHPDLAAEMDTAAKKRGVSVLGTGVNPGFVMDLLPIVMSGVCRDIRKITVERIQDASPRRLPFQQKIGAGLAIEQFRKKIKEGTLRHVGLTESMQMIAANVGWVLDKTEDIVEPVLATKRLKNGEMSVQAGQASGVSQTGRAFAGGTEVITLIFRAAIGEPEPRDRIIIEGTPNIDMIIQGGLNGDVATCSLAINAVPVALAARPGLRTMADIESVSFIR